MADGIESDEMRRELDRRRDAALRITFCDAVLSSEGRSLLDEVVGEHKTVKEYEHYPAGDVYDPNSHVQYYFHRHPTEDSDREYGHFHLFFRPDRAGFSAQPLFDSAEPSPDSATDRVCHLVAISLDAGGTPFRLFTTNQWVTGEPWYAAADVVRLLDRFRLDLDYPSRLVNRWLDALVTLFKPEIAALLRRRDAVVAARSRRDGDLRVLTDRSMDALSSLSIDLRRQIADANRVAPDVASASRRTDRPVDPRLRRSA